MRRESSNIWEDVALFACGFYLALIVLYTLMTRLVDYDVEVSPKSSAEIERQLIEAMPTLIPLDDVDCTSFEDPAKLAEIQSMAADDDPASRAGAAMLLAACPELAAQLGEVVSVLLSDDDPLVRALAEKAQEKNCDVAAQ